MKAEIISVGTELLLGDIVNTNAVFISKKLAEIGIDVYYQSVVGDNRQRLTLVFKEALGRSDIVILTGGLGPTKDDLTKEVIAKAMNLPLTLNISWLREIERMFKKRKTKMPVNNIKQALVPKGSCIIFNNNGTACGIEISKNGKLIYLLPGPPRELEPMFIEITEKLRHLSSSKLVSRVIKTYGIGESKMVEHIDDILSNQTDPTIAPLAKKDGVHLRVTTKSNIHGLKVVTNEILHRIGEYVWGFDDEQLNEKIIKQMGENNLTLSIVESCTGGAIASTLTDVSGSSKILLESQVLYTEKAKARYLNTSVENIPLGGIDLSLTESLALKSLKINNSTLSLAITGALGPSAPLGINVGRAYISIAYKEKVTTKEFNLSGTRENIKERCVFASLHLILQKFGEIVNEK